MNQEERLRLLEEEVKRLKGDKPAPDEPWQKIDWTEGMKMPPSAVRAMVAAVPDSLTRAIVGDNRPAPRSTPEPEPPRSKGTGWQEEVPLRSPPGIDICDRLVDAADARDRADRAIDA